MQYSPLICLWVVNGFLTSVYYSIHSKGNGQKGCLISFRAQSRERNLVDGAVSSWRYWADVSFSRQKDEQNSFKSHKYTDNFTCKDCGLWPHIPEAPYAPGLKESVRSLNWTLQVDHRVPSATTNQPMCLLSIWQSPHSTISWALMFLHNNEVSNISLSLCIYVVYMRNWIM